MTYDLFTLSHHSYLRHCKHRWSVSPCILWQDIMAEADKWVNIVCLRKLTGINKRCRWFNVSIVPLTRRLNIVHLNVEVSQYLESSALAVCSISEGLIKSELRQNYVSSAWHHWLIPTWCRAQDGMSPRVYITCTFLRFLDHQIHIPTLYVSLDHHNYVHFYVSLDQPIYISTFPPSSHLHFYVSLRH